MQRHRRQINVPQTTDATGAKSYELPSSADGAENARYLNDGTVNVTSYIEVPDDVDPGQLRNRMKNLVQDIKSSPDYVDMGHPGLASQLSNDKIR